MKRRVATHEECLKAFAAELKKEVNANMATWKNLDPKQATGRSAAYANVLFLLKRQAEVHGIPIADLGLVDYEVPRVPE